METTGREIGERGGAEMIEGGGGGGWGGGGGGGGGKQGIEVLLFVFLPS